MALSKEVHINGTSYPYKVYKSGVKVRFTGNRSVWISNMQLTGMTPDVIDYDRHKGSGPKITPSLVKQYIIDNYIKPSEIRK